MLNSILAILCGLLLLSNFFPKAAKSLKPAEGLLGLFAFVVGLMSFIAGVSLLNTAMILAGIILAVNLLPELKKVASALSPMRNIIGVVVLVAGIFGLF